jgi:type IV secretory pathway TraG/TraD family ATPase VirD4
MPFGFLKRLTKFGSPAASVQPEKVESNLFHADQPLLTLSAVDAFTIRDACQGVQVFGGTGSGKTSGSGKHLALAYLASGFGGLVLCAKPEERLLWQNLAAITAREDDLVIFDSTGDHYRFNFLDYEKNHAGQDTGLTTNIVQLLTEVVKAIEREEKGGQGEKPFWRNALRQLTTAVIELASFAELPIRFDLLADLVRSGPQSPAQWNDPAWQAESICYQCILEAEGKRSRDTEAEADFQKCRAYWIHDFAKLHPETRSSIVLSFTMVIDLFNARPLRKLLSSDTTVTPEDTFNGKVVILDMPMQTFHQAGRIAQFVWKYVWQRAVLRREVNDATYPVFLWADESQNFISDFDPEFQAVARSARACTVYLTQNISMYKRVLGEGSDNAVEAFLGNLQTKIFHQNSSTETNEWAADLFAKDWMLKEGQQVGWATGGVSGGTNTSMEMQHQVPPVTFTRLRTGSPQNDFIVEGIIYKGGTVFRSTGKNFIKADFTQH